VNICIPVDADQGVASPVCAHFGSARFFLVIDPEQGACRAIPNRNLHDAHGTCQPLVALQGEDIDAIVVGGIGMGALNKLLAAGLEVYKAQQPTVELVLAAFKAGQLRALTPEAVCGHHGHGMGHAHGQAHGHGHARGQ
jgi:predicted Fe-Mo cluster-binding NifX family protein